MITIRRVFDPQEVLDFEPHLVLPGGEDRKAYMRAIVTGMESTRDRVFVLRVMRSDALVGFTVAHDTDNPYTLIAQMWSEARNERQIAREMFARVMLWTYGLGKRRVRAYTTRPEAFERFAGFKVAEYVIEREIDDQVFFEGLTRVKELINGTPNGDRNNRFADGRGGSSSGRQGWEGGQKKPLDVESGTASSSGSVEGYLST